jgi:hypothetical protein
MIAIPKNELTDFTDQDLIDLVESEDNKYDQETIRIAESILRERGFAIEELEDYQTIKTIEKVDNFQVVESKNRKFYTRTDILTFHDSKITSLAKKIPQGTLVNYDREIYRNGLYLIRMKDENNTFSYTPKLDESLFLCTIYQVKNDHTTVLITDFKEFTKSNFNLSKRKNKMYNSNLEGYPSSITKKGNGTYVNIYNCIEEKGKKILHNHRIDFTSDMTHQLRLGTFSEDSIFYAIESENKNGINRIKLPDGKDAILFSNFENFKEINPFWQTLLFGSIALLAFAVVLIPSLWFATKTGWFIFIAFVFVPVAIFFTTVLGAPLFLLIEEIKKRF